MSFVYLASPYSHPDPAVREERFRTVCGVAARLMRSGVKVFSPIAHSHPIEIHGMREVLSGAFWLEQDFALLRHASKLLVLCLPDWQESKGIRLEVQEALTLGIPVEYINEHS